MSNLTTIVAEAVFLYGWRQACSVQRRSSRGHKRERKEELHLFRCTSVPVQVPESLRAAAGQYGYVPRRATAAYIRKGTPQNWANWVWQEAENGACIWWTGLDLPSGYMEVKFYQAL